MDSEWHSVTNSEFGGVPCTVPPVVDGDDSIVVGISQWSCASGERISERLQGGHISDRRGKSYLIHLSCNALHCVMADHPHRQTILCWMPTPCSIVTGKGNLVDTL